MEEIDRLLDDHTEGEVAAILNERNVVSGTGKPFDGRRVQVIRRAHGLASRKDRLRAAGLLSLEEVAARLWVHKGTVKERRRQGRLEVLCYRVDDVNRYMYEDPGHRVPADQASIAACPEEVQYE